MKTYSFKIYYVDDDLARNLKRACEELSSESSPVSVDIYLDSSDDQFKHAAISVSDIGDLYYLGRMVKMYEMLE